MLRVLAVVLIAPSALASSTPTAPLAPAPLAPSGPAAPSAPSRDLALSLLGHTIGVEHSSIDAGDPGRSILTSHFEYHDRGATIALDTTLAFAKDFTPLAFESHGKSYRYFAVNDSVPRAPGTPNTFTLDGMAPLAAQGVLIQYWLAHGRPKAITVLPSGDRVTIAEISGDAPLAGPLPRLRHFLVDGVIWGHEHVWLDADDLQVAAVTTTAGVLPFEAAEPRLEGALPVLKSLALRASLSTSRDAGLAPVQHDAFAIVGGRLIDATGAPAIERATVIVRNGRIAAAGPQSAIVVPRGMPTVDASGETILPGLWDMHAHVGQPEWGPIYLASGVTTIRDMGGEFDILTALRDAWNSEETRAPSAGRDHMPPAHALGPRLLLAGLVDGPGPDAFGSVTAGTPDEGRAVVARYKAANFQQMKIYTLVNRPTIAAVIDEAHKSGMTVTGHIPTSLTGGLREAVEMGFDNVAHLVVRGAPGSDELRDTIAFVKAHGTVMDPTISWNELLGRSAQTPIASFQPVMARVAPSLARLLEGANGGAVTPDQARDRLARSLQIIKALSDAGVPIVAGTDKGVPGGSVQREIELYVQAGIPPMDAIRAATAVPAKVMGLAGDSGTIAPGLRADLIVVDGNPLDRMSDIRKVTLVCARGRLYDTAPLWKAGGYR